MSHGMFAHRAIVASCLPCAALSLALSWAEPTSQAPPPGGVGRGGLRKEGEGKAMPDRRVKPVAAATWGFGEIAVSAAAPLLDQGSSALDALEAGITAVELDTREQYFVGLGGLPNAQGVMEFDAAVMDGATMSYGAVMAIRNVATPFRAARLVMERSEHSILAGEGAEAFAMAHGVPRTETLTSAALEEYLAWRRAKESGDGDNGHDGGGGPGVREAEEQASHDTIGMLCLDERGNLAAGTSTSGWKFKHPGRVGDSPVVGSGLYCDARAGAAVATGDGEEILRTCLSYLVVERMREGDPPQVACRKGISRLEEIVGGGPGPGGGHEKSDEPEREALASLSGLALDSEATGGTEGGGDSESSGRGGGGGGKSGSQAAWPSPPAPTPGKQHAKLTVAVMAMSPEGGVGAASTLGPGNPHRGRPAFPLALWQRAGGGGAGTDGEAGAGGEAADGEGCGGGVRVVEETALG